MSNNKLYKLCYNIGFKPKGCSISEQVIEYDIIKESPKSFLVTSKDINSNKRINKNSINIINTNERILLNHMLCKFAVVDSPDLIESTWKELKLIALKEALTIRGEIATSSRLQVNQLSDMISDLNS